jgi:hypothetical protein
LYIIRTKLKLGGVKLGFPMELLEKQCLDVQARETTGN